MEKLKILFIAADPVSAPGGRTPRLLLDQDLRQIREQTLLSKNRDAVEFDVRWVRDARELRRALLEMDPQIVHFSGHGDTEGLMLVDALGRSELADPASLAILFGLFHDVQVVVMSGCYSFEQAQAIATQVPYVLGTRSSISERASVAFDAAFYGAITYGTTVPVAFELAVSTLQLESAAEGDRPELLIHPNAEPSALIQADPLVAVDFGTTSTVGSVDARSSTAMYSLIVTAKEGAWNGRRYGIRLDRFGEHTTEGVRARFITLDNASLRTLMAMPALLAYENDLRQPARVAKITHIVVGSNDEIRFDFEPVLEILPIPADRLAQIRWELDITDWEMNRTHWAIKEIDLMDVLREAGLQGCAEDAQPVMVGGDITIANHWVSSVRPDISPTVFAIPSAPRDPRLVAVMMPFSHEFWETYREIEKACEAVGLRAERADTIWEESTIIQDVFNLIYRSAITIVDLTGRNPNVMYECGIAHTLGRPVLPISRSTEALPFDLAHHRILPYLPNSEGFAQMREKLERRLKSLAGTTP